jgi:hypothetical protein
MNSCFSKKLPAEMLRDHGIVITDLVMTFLQLSAAHEYPIGACREGFDDEQGIHSAGTHDSDRSDVRRVLKTGNPRRISRRIAAPVAEETQDPGFV